MRLIDADMLKNRFKVHYDLFVSAYKNEQDMSLADKSRVDEILNSMAEVINAPTVFDTDNATNGDVIKVMFDNDKISEFMGYVRIMARVGNWFNEGIVAEFDKDWWNSLYKR